MIDHILFDLDGTLTDPYEGITNCIQYALDKVGVKEKQELGWCIGPPLIETFKVLLRDYPDLDPAEGVRLYRERFGTVGLLENKVYQGIPELLKEAQSAGKTLYVATSKPGIYAKRIIEHFNLQSHFVQVYGSELDGTRTDKVDLLDHILQSEKLDPQKTLMIGDRKYDELGANAHGVKFFAVLWGYGQEGEFSHLSQEFKFKKPESLRLALK